MLSCQGVPIARITEIKFPFNRIKRETTSSCQFRERYSVATIYCNRGIYWM